MYGRPYYREKDTFYEHFQYQKVKTPVCKNVAGAINNFMFDHKEVMSLFKHNGWWPEDKL